jgi:hypothetical protein
VTITAPSGPLFRDTADFQDIVLAAAEQLDVQPLAVEKDYWVCEALRGLAAAYPNNIVFKGGTSLEKLRIIQRFSEDLDLLVIGDLGSYNETKEALKAMVAVAGGAVGDNSPERVGAGGKRNAFHRSAYVKPSLKNKSTGGIADTNAVLVELGQAGGPNPHQVHSVSSLLATQLATAGVDVSQWVDLAPFDVTILHPGRTLIEKLLRVNNFAQRPDDQNGTHAWSRIGRQFYDIWALINDPNVQALLADKSQVSEILDSINKVSQTYKGDEPVPDGGFAASPAFDPAGPLATGLQREHDAAIANLYYGNPDDAPAFQDVLDRVHQHADLLNPV